MAGGEQAEAAALGADEVPLEKRGWQCGTRRKSSIALRFSHSVSHKFLVDTVPTTLYSLISGVVSSY